jgi:pyridinium-3,5-bisthiocarboxylic acid mononucleotide nickel chelatase
MITGALIDAGADAPTLFAGLDSLGTGARFRAERVKRKGIMGTQFIVEHEDQKKHRHLPHIVKMIEAAELPEPVKRNAVTHLQRAGRGRGASARRAHREGAFPRSGRGGFDLRHRGRGLRAVSAGVEQVHVSPVNTGSGTVEADHGVMPVPTPATALLLRGQAGVCARTGNGADDADGRGHCGGAGRGLDRCRDDDRDHGLRRGYEGVSRRTRTCCGC